METDWDSSPRLFAELVEYSWARNQHDEWYVERSIPIVGTPLETITVRRIDLISAASVLSRTYAACSSIDSAVYAPSRTVSKQEPP